MVLPILKLGGLSNQKKFRPGKIKLTPIVHNAFVGVLIFASMFVEFGKNIIFFDSRNKAVGLKNPIIFTPV